MKAKTNQELRKEVDRLTKVAADLKRLAHDQYTDIISLRQQVSGVQHESKLDLDAAITIRKALEAEIYGLRKELAQSQSALYTLINKLPETL